MTFTHIFSKNNTTFHLIACLVSGSIFGLLFDSNLFWAIGIKLLCIASIYSTLDRTVPLKQGLYFGWAWGASATLTGMAWLYTAMHDIGGMPSSLAAIALVLFSLLLGVFNGVSGLLFSRLKGGAFCFAAIWVVGEWLRTWVLTGLPWMNIGYGFLDTPLAALAPHIGVLGVGAGTCLLAAYLSLWLNRKYLRSIIATGAVLCICWGLGLVQYTQPYQTQLKIALVQGNVPQNLKFDPEQSKRYMASYLSLSSQNTALHHPLLTVLPETALPTTIDRLPIEIWEGFKSLETTLVMGNIGQIHQTQSSNKQVQSPQYTNRLTTPFSNDAWQYDKVHLVPFGEVIPWSFQWLVNLMNIPLSSLARGDLDQKNLRLGSIEIASNICYESIFAHEWHARGASAHLLLNASNFGWYGDSSVMPQHVNISRMRALEFQKPYLSATNNGMTLAINARGEIQSMLEKNTAGVLNVQVQAMQGQTPYSRWGDWGIIVLALLVLIYSGWRTQVRSATRISD